MKKTLSIFLGCLCFLNNFFYFSFAENGVENIREGGRIAENEAENTGEGTRELLRISENGVENIREGGRIAENEAENTGEGTGELLRISENRVENGGEGGRIAENGVEKKESVEVNLIISEVFFGGRNEWIEIYNEGDDFVGDLEFSGASTSSKKISNISIPAGEMVVVGNSGANNIIAGIEVKALDDGKFSISDEKEFQIKLIYSGEILDTFGAVATKKNRKKSFHRFLDTKTITGTIGIYSDNMSSGYLANPGKIYNESDENPGEEPEEESEEEQGEEQGEEPEEGQQEEQDEKPNEPISSTANLKLTEIYFDGDKNWFEITNIGSKDFGGQFTLSGNLDLIISAQIPAGISKVFANDLEMFQTGKNVEIIQNNISFGDDEIDLDLVWSGEVLDKFFVHKSWVNFMKDKRQSAEKVGESMDWITTRTSWDRIYNTLQGISANPGKYFTSGENMKDITQDKNGGEMPHNTGGNEDCNNLVSAMAEISEIYFGNSTYSPYVEIMIKDDILGYYDQLLLSGDALTENVIFDISEINNDQFLLLTNSDLWYDNGRNAVANANFKISKTGIITLCGVSGEDLEILDIVHVEKIANNNALYMSSNSPICPNIFGYEDKFSPGMTIGQSHFIQITPDPIVKYISVGGGGSCQSNENQVFNTEIPLGSEIQISAIKYYGDYQILKLKNKSNLDINLREYSLQTLDGQTQTIKGNTLFAKSNMSFVGKYGLDFGQDFCVNLLKGNELVDRYCRNSLTKANEKDVENILNQMDFWRDLENDEIESGDETQDVQEVLTGKNDIVNIKNIKIIDVDYDPDGPDLDNESITLLLLTGEQVDLKEYRIQYIKDEKTFEKKIEGILSRGNQQIFKGAFNFPNSTKDKQPVIVQLIGANKNVIDSFVYNPNKITEIPSGNYEVVSVIDGDTIKISYQNQVFSIRLAGIDAPESSTLRCGKVECYGPESKQYLTDLLEGKNIFFEPENMDTYDRFVGYIFLDGENINENLVKNGFAWEYTYKDKSYKYQSDFKAAEKYAKTNLVGLWGSQCDGKRLCPVDETKLKDSFVFEIENIVYDPDGPDNGNEEIWISMIKGFDIEFGDSLYLLVNDSKKSLKKYGKISIGETKKLKGTFNFPNNKKTIVSLLHHEEILDSYIYDPDLDKLDKDRQMSTGNEILDKIGEISIISILPDPIGADGDNEEISIFYVGNAQIMDLSGFFLQVGKTKKKLVGVLKSGKENVLKGSFGFPNKASCVEIGYGTTIFDKFCYGQTKQGQKFLKSNDVIEVMNSADLSVLKKSKLKNIDNKVCLTYMDQVISCKNMPYSKLSEKKIKQNGLYKNFFDSFEKYLKSEWKIMYYDSEIKNYFDLLNEIEKAISDGNSDFEINGKTYKISEFATMYESKYKKDIHDFMKQGMSTILPDSVLNKYSQLKKEYNNMLK